LGHQPVGQLTLNGKVVPPWLWLTFPGGKGLAIGVTGTVTYKGKPYPGTPPTGLPVPPPPTDEHHLQL
jgi:hypothetical protein